MTQPTSLSDRRARRVRAGSPPPSSERAELRAAMKHGPYSFGAPPMPRQPTADEVEESLQARMKAAEDRLPPLVRAPFVWSLGLALAIGLYSLFLNH